MPDFRITDHGSILVLTPVSDEGRAWVDEHLPDDAMSFAGGIVVEPRYIADIADGIVAGGLTIGD